jgi:hypothetical protein
VFSYFIYFILFSSLAENGNLKPIPGKQCRTHVRRKKIAEKVSQTDVIIVRQRRRSLYES